ncbi:nitrate- and nitrite sensing domain-containing protein [Methylophaga sp.]|uniref:nitrate- and nitrite sensing domain-containing protein n=1 Tax=Methylophaga sp. TaxID=2024840 RepID=UPI003F6968CD
MYPMFVGGFTVLCLIFLIGRFVSLRKQERNRIEQGIVLTVHLKRIIDSCQKHRGTSNAINQGNNKLKPQLVNLQSDIDRLVQSNYSDNLQRFPQWESFAEHWPRLKRHALAGDLKSHNLVRQHSLMIDGQLSLLDDVMRDHDLHRMMLDRTTRVSEVCLDTLRVAETVGQTRAIGSGICAHGTCEGADRIIIDFLRISVQNTTQELLKEINSIKNDDLQSKLQGASHSIKSTVEKLVDMVETQVLKEGRLQIDTNDYFNLSTRAIDEVLKVFGIIIHYASHQHRRMI